jgi:3-polyprenyl-4-hydroxybenzoate decarboxylase
MLNKIFFILIGILIFLLIGYFIFKKNKEEIFPEVSVVEEEIEISKENVEEAKLLFLEVEKSFYNILENIFLRGEDVTNLLSVEITEIENNLKNVKEGLEEETISRKELDENLSNIQRKMQLLVEKLIEIDS